MGYKWSYKYPSYPNYSPTYNRLTKSPGPPSAPPSLKMSTKERALGCRVSGSH